MNHLTIHVDASAPVESSPAPAGPLLGHLVIGGIEVAVDEQQGVDLFEAIESLFERQGVPCPYVAARLRVVS